jgi:hypothetical protein
MHHNGSLEARKLILGAITVLVPTKCGFLDAEATNFVSVCVHENHT